MTTLQAVFEFTEEDLRCNRAGRLSPTQQRVQSGSLVKRRVVSATVGFVGLAVAAALAYPLATDGVYGNLGRLVGALGVTRLLGCPARACERLARAVFPVLSGKR